MLLIQKKKKYLITLKIAVGSYIAMIIMMGHGTIPTEFQT